jgi:hypothetical protein
VEEDHAKLTLEALELLEPDTGVVFEATRLIGDAWWQFMDESELLAS